MSPVGIANAIVASSVIDKVQNAQHLQVDIHQKQAEAQALREQNQQRTTVTTSKEGEKVKMREHGEEGKKKRRQGQQQTADNETADETYEASGEESPRRHINITI